MSNSSRSRQRTAARKRAASPSDFIRVADPMSKPDPIYAVTCNEHRRVYGYPGITTPVYYGQKGWPQEYLLALIEPGGSRYYGVRGYVTNPWPEPDAEPVPAWVPYSVREGYYDPEVAAESQRLSLGEDTEGWPEDPMPEHLTQRVIDAIRADREKD